MSIHKSKPIICQTYDDLSKLDYKRHSIFLAGPTPRSKNVKSWRPKAIELLEDYGFGGVIYSPEYSKEAEIVRKEIGKNWYEKQIEWEHNGLDDCDIILMWVPRDLETMPAFTTNVEFGLYINTDKNNLIYGRPDNTPKNEYLDYCYEKITGNKPINNLEELVEKCINEIW